MSRTLLELAGVSTFYGAVQALKNVDLTVDEGEIVTLIGANGAGKSTLMMTICGQPRARGGRIRYDGAEITALPTHRIMRRGIAQAPEGRRIFPRMSVRENLLMGAESTGQRASEAEMARVFALFPRLAERHAQRGGTLSGGEQQMLAIARALMMKPRLLILDEPTLGLAPVILEQLSKALAELRRTTPITVLLGEQNVTFALPHADRVYVLEHARIVWEGDPGRFAEEAGTAYL